MYSRRQIRAFFDRISPTFTVALVCLAIAVAFGLDGHDQVTDKRASLFVQNFYANISVELASIAGTVFILDVLRDRYTRRQQKKSLIRRLASQSSQMVSDAIHELRFNEWINDWIEIREDLSEADLSYQNLEDANFKRAVLEKANVRYASLISTTFIGAEMSQADLTGARVLLSNLAGTNLINATLTTANFQACNLQGARMNHVQASGANFQKADFTRANLANGNFVEADFSWATLQGAYLNGANLTDSRWASVADMYTKLATTQTLKGATLPDGGLYNGCLNLPSDLREIARLRQQNSTLDAQSAAAEYYGVSLAEYNRGQQWRKDNPFGLIFDR